MHYQIWQHDSEVVYDQHKVPGDDQNWHIDKTKYFMFTPLPDTVDLLDPQYAFGLTYEGDIADRDNPMTALDELYTMFNMGRPEDFRHYSLSVGDMIKLDKKWYACERFGWKEITVTGDVDNA